MNVNFTAKPINFKLGEYLSKGFELLKKDFGNIFVAFLCCLVMGIIPFCGMLGAGNFYEYLRKVNRGQQASPSDVFNFDKFMPYFILQLILIGGFMLIYIPFMILMPVIAYSQGDDPSPWIMFIMMPIFAIIYIAFIYIMLKGFYIPALISLKDVTDIKTAWNTSKVMTKGNLLSIFLFSLLLVIIMYAGILACGIGLFATMPFVYVANYFAYEDAMSQIEHDEISEIGIQEKY
ncbi:hypothetical protein [Chryseobacterium chendengshani]|uniref:hypothetical protein n=1 Tax=unclassified Chryseobacterium TaxID=2593645 RepID=UPI001C641A0C|nr:MULTISPECIES: hypothetical protein [unclassified Chryseobacterium]MBW7675176.1 hypothetical protein [Chryseobacterium sp. LJ756]MBW8522274.1 hypothetical protein [Chryseobacterium sp. LJ668]QYK17913.1 hypothetical protein K0U91_07300 [Chryseobacterium sp. LJ668]